MGFHYAHDHDLAGFWGRSANSRIEFTEKQPLLRLLVIVNIGPCGVPTRDASLFASYWVPSQERPAIFPIFSPKTCFGFVREAVYKFISSFANHAF